MTPSSHTARQTAKPIRIERPKDGDGGLLFTDRGDEERYLIQFARLAELLRQEAKQDQLRLQFELLLDRLHEWCVQNAAKIKSATITIRDERPLFLVVNREWQFDPDFEEAIALLQYEVYHDPEFDLISLGFLSLPPASPESLDSFRDNRVRLQLFGSAED